MSELELDTHAAHAAEYLWWTARRDVAAPKLLRESVRVRLASDAEADFAFGLFDLDGDGFVVEDEVHCRLRQMYRCAAPSLQRFLLLCLIFFRFFLLHVAFCGSRPC